MAAFAQRLIFSSQPGVDESEPAPGGAKVRSRFDYFLLRHTRRRKSGVSSGVVFGHAGNQSFGKPVVKFDPVSAKISVAKRRQRGFGIGGIPFGQGGHQPNVSNSWKFR